MQYMIGLINLMIGSLAKKNNIVTFFKGFSFIRPKPSQLWLFTYMAVFSA